MRIWSILLIKSDSKWCMYLSKSLFIYLSVFTGHMNYIGKKSKLNAPRKRCMNICFSFRCNSYGPWTPTKCCSILIFTSVYNKVCHSIAFFNTKMSYLSDFKRTKSKTLRTASTGRMTNWTKPPCGPVQIIRTKDWYFINLQRVWHASRERLPFRTPGSVPHCGTCLCSNCWDQIPRTCHVFTRLFTSKTPWYFLDFA